MAPKLPQQFGPYTLQELIARGGMAEIYRATMPGAGGFEKTVAIKKILPHLAENDEFITMLIDEARIIVSINHANIAQVYDLGKIADDYYIAMEFIHGIDLSTIVKDLKESGRTVPVEHAIFIGSSIAAGLHVAHNKCDDGGLPLNIVHRDVSPHNILISFAGDVKIVDFGVAKARGKEANTQLGVIKGKLLYMSPEQAMAKEVDGRADLFAAGLILYRMLTNHLPFEGDNEFQIYNYILSKEITPPRAFNPDIPEEVNQIIMMLLQRDPSKRYQDGYSAKVDLDRALQNIAPGYSISRLSRWVEDNFTHLAQKNRPKQKSGQNEWAPSTPPRNQMGTDQMSTSDEWDEIDEMEDTINLSMDSPEAQQALRQAEQARAAWQGEEATASGAFQTAGHSGSPGAQPPWGAPTNSGATRPMPANISGQLPAHQSGQFGAASQSGQFGAASQSGQFGAASQSGQFGAANQSGQFGPPGQSGQFASGQFQGMPGPNGNTFGQARTQASHGDTGRVSQEDAVSSAGETRVAVVPLVGILLLLLAIALMLGYQLLLASPESDPVQQGAEAVIPDEPGVTPTPTEPVVVAEADDDAGAADSGTNLEQPDSAATVEVDVKSDPAGAKVYNGEELLGTTPLQGELERGEEVVVLRLEKDGYEVEEVRVIPFDNVRKNVSLDRVEGQEPEVEKQVKPRPKPKKKRRRRPPKKSTKPDDSAKSSAPAVPLLGLDEEPSDDSDEEDIINPFGD